MRKTPSDLQRRHDLPFHIAANAHFDVVKSCWFPCYQKQVRQLLDEVLIPYWGDQRVSHINQEDKQVFRAHLAKVAPEIAYKGNLISDAERHLRRILTETADLSKFIADHYGAKSLIPHGPVPSHFIFIQCYSTAWNIADGLCHSFGVSPVGRHLITSFSSYKKSSNLEAITDWVIDQWAEQGYGIENTSSEEEFLQKDLERLFLRKLGDIQEKCMEGPVAC